MWEVVLWTSHTDGTSFVINPPISEISRGPSVCDPLDYQVVRGSSKSTTEWDESGLWPITQKIKTTLQTIVNDLGGTSNPTVRVSTRWIPKDQRRRKLLESKVLLTRLDSVDIGRMSGCSNRCNRCRSKRQAR